MCILFSNECKHFPGIPVPAAVVVIVVDVVVVAVIHPSLVLGPEVKTDAVQGLGIT